MAMLTTLLIIIVTTTTGMAAGWLLARHGERQRTQARRLQHWAGR